MGQYHYVVNYDKREFIHPHAFNDGLKLMEFGSSAQATMTAVAVLLAASCQGGARGGGDIHPWTGGVGYEGREVPGLTEERGQWLMDNIVGRWAGDRIAIIGDYAEGEDANGLVAREGTPFSSHDEKHLHTPGRGGLITWAPPADTKPDTPWIDISALALEAIEMDFYTYQDHHLQQFTTA